MNISHHFSKNKIDRDHRKIGQQLDLYHIQKEAPGMVFWHSKGLTLFREIENFIRTKYINYDYQETRSPIMMDSLIWKKTGHWDNYAEHMFSTKSENKKFCIKPMNCPGHIQIFNNKLRSYRDLPLRIAEFGICHRDECSGSLHGLMRTKMFTQDDAHIFCSENQIRNEINNCIKIIYETYETFGFKKILVKLSTRPKKRIGHDNIWDKAEQDLALSLKERNIIFEYQLGEGVFYGPKIEFTLFDCLNRPWQCGTIQLDFSLAKLLNTFYIEQNNKKTNPVIIHRAILGSIERFIGILTEEYNGFYPTWLSPIQVVVMNITKNQYDYVMKIKQKMLSMGFRVKSDLRNEKISFKIRDHTLQRIPYMLICGDKEMQSGNVTVRTRRGKNINNFDVDKFILLLKEEISNRNFYEMEGTEY